LQAPKPDGSILEADVEGLTIYYADNGTGYLLASSQGDSTYAVFSRTGNNEYLGSFAVGSSNGVDSVEESDGADVINVPLGSQFPFGLLVVQDGNNDPAVVINDDGEIENASSNFKFIPWQQVATAFPDFLKIDPTSFDPRYPSGIGKDGNNTFLINQGDVKTILGFGDVGTGIQPSDATIAEVDTLQFQGEGLTAQNLLLTQQGDDLAIAFAGSNETQVTLKNFRVENLENLQKATGASVNLGNILFDGQNTVGDSFDVFDANSQRRTVFNRNSVTFLNDLDNTAQGFNSSKDVINGQGGDDKLEGLSGDDLLRGGAGSDTLLGGDGKDILIGGADPDQLTGGKGRDQFELVISEGIDTITDFEIGRDLIRFVGSITPDQLAIAQGVGARLNDTVISVAGQETAILLGIQSTDVNSTSFIFL
jgi:Ca2+-binding RTX toxin-like protein